MLKFLPYYNFDHDKARKDHTCLCGHPTFGAYRSTVLSLSFYRRRCTLDTAVWLVRPPGQTNACISASMRYASSLVAGFYFPVPIHKLEMN